ncbi:glycosyltransferase family 2 protein [Aquirufa rosea]|uniref:Glycosyltransferase n=1 Tax=Aquirufa rosea TaxID=2509241 RepID=A0A4Q1C1B7_9BACT|nr:glycosyltransferase [Aquirufa rosea]RXK50898.1 glycosyltransferase [Aquirufa rosea]
MEPQISYFSPANSEDKPFFSILIPTWNNLAFLQNCIRSIRTHSTTSYQLVVHINEGSDGTLEWIQAQGDITYSYSHENVGVCYAMNAMRKLATADYLLYLNDDMYVLPNWDGILKEEVLSCPNHYFFISATMIEPSAQSNCSIEQNYGTTLANFDEERLLKEWNHWEKKDWQGSTWPPNVVHKDLWDQVGGYSIEFSPGMYSDPDFSMKLWQAGVRLFKGVARSRVYHFGSISVKRVKQNKGYYQFIRTWGMSSGTFSKYYLQRGKPFTGPLEKKWIPFWVHWKNGYYRWRLWFNK